MSNIKALLLMAVALVLVDGQMGKAVDVEKGHTTEMAMDIAGVHHTESPANLEGRIRTSINVNRDHGSDLDTSSFFYPYFGIGIGYSYGNPYYGNPYYGNPYYGYPYYG